MIKLDEQYVVSRSGKKVGVMLPVADYRKLLEELEELESIRAYDAAKASGEEAIPFKRALRQLRRRK
jgi:PHD/YefM family antitoxin component YafN of YafNO toxin-antitoxin module